jgi:hypothetical protein
MLERRIVLEDEADIPSLRRDSGRRDAIYDHRAGVRLFEAADDPEQRGFPTAAWAEERGEPAAADLNGHVVERSDPAEGLADVNCRYAHRLIPVVMIGPPEDE